MANMTERNCRPPSPSAQAVGIFKALHESDKTPAAQLAEDLISAKDAERFGRLLMQGVGLARVAGDWRSANEFLPHVAKVYRDIAAKADEMADAINTLYEEVQGE